MKSKITWLVTLFLMLFVQFAFAQKDKTVTGVVIAKEFGDPLPGASVIIQGTEMGTETDMEGAFSLRVKEGDKLVVKFTGFKDAIVTVGASNVLNVSMIEDEEGNVLDELVVTNYVTTSKPKSNVAASTVTSKTIEGRPNASLIQTLQGQVPGLNIATGSGQPGSDNTSVILRGVGSINGSTSPLFVIDGVPMSDDRFRSINPNDIETVTVLKDAGATSIYGNRGANGVVVITTKRGSFNQDLSIKYTGTTGISFLQKDNYNMMSGSELRAFENKTGRVFRRWTQDEIDNAPNTNWRDIFFREAFSQNHTISFTSGSQNLNSFTSVGYGSFEGILKGSDMNRFTFRNNLTGKNTNGRLKYSTNVNANYSKSTQLEAVGSNTTDNFLVGALKGLPYITPDEYDGTYESLQLAEQKYSLGMSPLTLLNKAENVGLKQNEFKFIASGNIEYEIFDNITVGNQSGLDYQTIHQTSWQSPDYYFQIDNAKSTGQEYWGRQGQVNETRFVFNSTTNLKWNQTFNDVHTVSAGLYMEYIKAHFLSNGWSKTGFDPVFFAPGSDSGWIADDDKSDFYVPTVSASKFNSGLFSYFGMVDYDYDTRYGIGASLRRDASFRFTDENRWGTFWSVSARWNINNEKFMENSIFTDLKLRGSYGTSGNQDITGAGLFGGANLFSTLYSSARGYNDLSSLVISQLPNTDLQWETVTQANIGLDFGLFNNRLRGSFDVYKKQTDDLYQSRRISAINGTTNINANFGSMKNEGIEAIFAADVLRKKDTRVTINFNGSYNKNTILDVPTDQGWYWDGEGLNGMKEGNPYGEFYLVKYAGINPNNGKLQFYDKNGDLTENPTDDDRVWTNKTQFPVYQGSFGLDVEHKGWFLNANFTYAFDVWRFDNDYYWATNPNFMPVLNMSNDYQDYWRNDNRDATFPAINASNLPLITNSDFYIKDASYVRLRYLTVGYNFNKEALKQIKLSGLRVFAQGENLYTWTKWKGFDAESPRNVDFGQYPTPRIVSFGVEVQF